MFSTLFENDRQIETLLFVTVGLYLQLLCSWYFKEPQRVTACRWATLCFGAALPWGCPVKTIVTGGAGRCD